MKIIGMDKLKVGDIFTYELKLKGRESFMVVEPPGLKTVKVKLRHIQGKEFKEKRIKGDVWLLRNVLT